MRPTDDTNWITKLTIGVTSNSNRVYANGNQQLQVTVSVTPKKDIVLTDEQLDSIQLVTLDDDGIYRELSAGLYASPKRDERFEYFQSTGVPPANLEYGSTIRRKKFYISSTRPGGSLDKVYAAIRKDENTLYISETSRFNSFAIVESITPLRMTREDFSFWGEDVVNEEIDDFDADFDTYHLSFKDKKYRLVDSIPFGADEGVCYYQNQIDVSPWYYSIPSGEAPNTRYQQHFHYAYRVGTEKSFVFQNVKLKVSRPNVMNFVRLKITIEDYNIAYKSEPSRWGLLDQYGNMHKIEMTQESNGNIPNFKMYE